MPYGKWRDSKLTATGLRIKNRWLVAHLAHYKVPDWLIRFRKANQAVRDL